MPTSSDELQDDYDARQVTVTRVRRHAGAGSVDDPHRVVTDYWSPDGRLLASDDPHAPATMREGLLNDALEDLITAFEMDTLTPDRIELYKKLVK